MRPLKDVRPDLIVGHSGFGSTLYLRELYPDVPVMNFFEYFYRPHDVDSDMDFRADLGWPLEDQKYLRSRTRNAMILLDLDNCQLGYSPTDFQRTRFPDEYQAKLRTVFDGIDRRVYHGHDEALRPSPATRGPRTIAGVHVPAGVRVVTYCARGFESMRGFDIFMRAAKLICDRDPNVIFLIAGTDRIAYGGDEQHLNGKTFKQWTLEQQAYDLDRIKFLGRVEPRVLAEMLAAGDLHMYLTVPFVLSWSMMDAMSAGAIVLGSRTSPVMEMIRDGENGLLADFFDPEEFAEKALKVLADPGAYRPLGRAAERMIEARYSLEAVTPQMLKLYEDAISDDPRPRAAAAAGTRVATAGDATGAGQLPRRRSAVSRCRSRFVGRSRRSTSSRSRRTIRSSADAAGTGQIDVPPRSAMIAAVTRMRFDDPSVSVRNGRRSPANRLVYLACAVGVAWGFAYLFLQIDRSWQIALGSVAIIVAYVLFAGYRAGLRDDGVDHPVE